MSDMGGSSKNKAGGAADSRRNKRRKNRQENSETVRAIKGIQNALAEKDVNNIIEVTNKDLFIQRTPDNAADF